MLYRWLLPVVAVLAFLASSVTAFAASGLVGDTTCCCPDPDTCDCHDHDGEQPTDDEMRRCGGEVQLVAPQPVPATVTEVTGPALEPRTSFLLEPPTRPMPPTRTERPDVPPF